MTQYHEPTNEELWAQPPAGAPRPVPPVPAVIPPQQMQPTPPPQYPALEAKPDRSRFALAIVSLALGIPLTAIAASYSGTFGLILSWVGIVMVNAVYGFGGRNRP
jgi:U5 snRNP spliceosome subunit